MIVQTFQGNSFFLSLNSSSGNVVKLWAELEKRSIIEMHINGSASNKIHNVLKEGQGYIFWSFWKKGELCEKKEGKRRKKKRVIKHTLKYLCEA